MTQALRWRARTRRWVTLAGLTMAIQACVWTSRPPNEVILQSVHGENALVYFGREAARGELLALTDSSLVLLSANNGRVVVAPLSIVQRIEFGIYTTYDPRSEGFTADHKEQLRRRSRFPYGLSNEAMTMLLQAAGQTRAEVLTPRP